MVVGSVDPNPVVAGKGLRILEHAGVDVVTDVLRTECDAINRHFFHYITTDTPYIVDGRRREGESDAAYAGRRRRLYATYAAVLGACPTDDRVGASSNPNGTEEVAGSDARLPDQVDRLDVSDGAFAHFDGQVQPVEADEVVVGRHEPLFLNANTFRSMNPTELDAWMRGLGRRKIDSIVVEEAEILEVLSRLTEGCFGGR